MGSNDNVIAAEYPQDLLNKLDEPCYDGLRIIGTYRYI